MKKKTIFAYFDQEPNRKAPIRYKHVLEFSLFDDDDNDTRCPKCNQYHKLEVPGEIVCVKCTHTFIALGKEEFKQKTLVCTE